MAVYLGASLTLLKEDGEKLLASYQRGSAGGGDFHQPLAQDAQYLAIVARHFPERLRKVGAADLERVVRSIGSGEFNTLSAAYAVVALKNYARAVAATSPALQITEVAQGRDPQLLRTSGAVLKRAEFSAEANRLQFTTDKPGLPLFFQMVEAGFDTAVPAEPSAHGIEVHRRFPASAQLGEPMKVRVQVRALGDAAITNAAITDLLPGGFELVRDSIPNGGFDHVEVREDRVVFFCTIGRDVQTFSYEIKATNRGEFVVPPVIAESMYERGVHGRGAAGKVVVTE